MSGVPPAAPAPHAPARPTGPRSSEAPTPTFRVILNHRPGADWNTCGQAAIATVLAFHRLGPFAPGADALDDGAAVDWVRATHPPDLPLGLGTSAWRIAAALRSHGLSVRRVDSGWLGRRPGRALEALRDHAAAGFPVPVCIDTRSFGGARLEAHWGVVTSMDETGARLGNARLAAPLALEDFMRAWRCRHLPWPHHHCALIAGP